MGAINLKKGQNVNLSKDFGNATMSKIQVGFGWNMPSVASAASKGGLLSRIIGVARAAASSGSMDLDFSVFLLDQNDKLVEVIFYRKLSGANGAVKHYGDDRVGGGAAKDPNEKIDIDLASMPANIHKAVVTVNIFSGGQNFSVLENAFVVMNDHSGSEMCYFELNGKEMGQHNTCYVAEIYRHNGDWKFKATGMCNNDGFLGVMESRYR